jgi:hypothetical protein
MQLVAQKLFWQRPVQRFTSIDFVVVGVRHFKGRLQKSNLSLSRQICVRLGHNLDAVIRADNRHSQRRPEHGSDATLIADTGAPASGATLFVFGRQSKRSGLALIAISSDDIFFARTSSLTIALLRNATCDVAKAIIV